MTTSEQLLVLLVDDSAEAREMYRRVFTGVGCEADQASDGFAAFDKAMKRRPDAIVMDLRMPRLDWVGSGTAAEEPPPDAEIPIVALRPGRRRRRTPEARPQRGV